MHDEIDGLGMSSASTRHVSFTLVASGQGVIALIGMKIAGMLRQRVASLDF